MPRESPESSKSDTLERQTQCGCNHIIVKGRESGIEKSGGDQENTEFESERNKSKEKDDELALFLEQSGLEGVNDNDGNTPNASVWSRVGVPGSEMATRSERLLNCSQITVRVKWSLLGKPCLLLSCGGVSNRTG